MENAEEFWKLVNQLIKAQKTKQEAIAASCDISIQTLRGWITKKRFPNAPEAHRIAQALGTTVEYLISGKDPEKPDTAGLVKHAEALLDGLKKL